MRIAGRDPATFLPLGTEALVVLLAVANEPRHGYGIIRDVEERSDGAILLQTGALYRTLKRLRLDGLLAEVPAPSGQDATDQRRRYYTTTVLGTAVLQAEVDRMAMLVRAARRVVAGRSPRFA